jgi:SAM-dependent methyltransferase
MDVTAPGFDADHAARLGAYDLVVCSEVIEHIPDDALAARRLASLVRPGGVLIITVPGGAKSKFDIHIGHQRHYRPAEAASLLRAAGMKIEAELAWGFPFHSLYRTAVRVASHFAVGDPAPQPPGERRASITSAVLAGAYTAFGRAMQPLFYLNLNRGGEQTIVVARR